MIKKLSLLIVGLFLTSQAWGALAENPLTSGSSGTDATSYATASVTEASNALVLLLIYNRSATNPAAEPTVTGNGLTWQTVVTRSMGNHRITLVRSLGASPSTGTATIDFGVQTQQRCSWSMAEFTGVDTSGSNGSGAIVQSDSTEGTSTSYTITLAAFGSANNMAYGGKVHLTTENSVVGSGFTEIHDVQMNDGGGLSTLQSEYKLNDNSVDASWTTSAFFGAVACEIKEAVASTGIPPIIVESD